MTGEPRMERLLDEWLDAEGMLRQRIDELMESLFAVTDERDRLRERLLELERGGGEDPP